ncbi:PAS domain S-box protein [Clostridium botulinum]|nr:PAS domain S-box protein [Clostridium botulinum]
MYGAITYKNENCYNLLIRNSKDAILVHRYGKIIFANERLKQMLGYKKNIILRI